MGKPMVFVSYSRQDETEKTELVTQLNVLQSAGRVKVWSDDRISGGADWKSEIREAMEGAKVAILLISANFLTSKFILEEEVPRLLRRRKTENLATFPVIAQPSAWQLVDWLARMNVRPWHGKPVWRDGGRYAAEELARIAVEVADVLEEKGTALSSEVRLALNDCIARNLRLSEASASLLPLMEGHVATLRAAFATVPVDLGRIRQVLGALELYPQLAAQVKFLLQEPLLQQLARRSGQQSAYEKIAFSEP